MNGDATPTDEFSCGIRNSLAWRDAGAGEGDADSGCAPRYHAGDQDDDVCRRLTVWGRKKISDEAGPARPNTHAMTDRCPVLEDMDLWNKGD